MRKAPQHNILAGFATFMMVTLSRLGDPIFPIDILIRLPQTKADGLCKAQP